MQNLEERRKRLEQRKQKLKDQEQKLKEMMRKKRTRHLIEIGALIEKAGLSDLSKDTLYGAFLHIQNTLDANQHTWKKQGGIAFQKEKAKRKIRA